MITKIEAKMFPIRWRCYRQSTLNPEDWEITFERDRDTFVCKHVSGKIHEIHGQWDEWHKLFTQLELLVPPTWGDILAKRVPLQHETIDF